MNLKFTQNQELLSINGKPWPSGHTAERIWVFWEGNPRKLLFLGIGGKNKNIDSSEFSSEAFLVRPDLSVMDIEQPLYRFEKVDKESQIIQLFFYPEFPRLLKARSGYYEYLLSAKTGRIIKLTDYMFKDYPVPVKPDQELGNDLDYDRRSFEAIKKGAPPLPSRAPLGGSIESQENAMLGSPAVDLSSANINFAYTKLYQFSGVHEANGTWNSVASHLYTTRPVSAMSIVNGYTIFVFRPTSDEPAFPCGEASLAAVDRAGRISIEEPRPSFLPASSTSTWEEFHEVEGEPDQAIGVMTGGEKFRIDLKTGKIIEKVLEKKI